MDKINILVIEDTKAESDLLLESLHANGYHVVGVATNYIDALKLFYQEKIDLVIVDVFLNGQPDGITFAETITITPDILKPFVFLTSSNDRQVFERAKLTKPFAFLLKPFNELEVVYAIEMAIEKFYEQQHVFTSEEKRAIITKDYLFIKKKNALKKVSITDIIYVAVEERYCNIITQKENFLVALSLLKVMEILGHDFIRTHRNYLVNTTKIIEIFPTDNLIILQDNHKVNFSDNYKSIIQNLPLLK
jgi:two-component system, LytTR family, response regulator